MGKADIISHAGDGLYNVQIRYNRDRYTATIAKLDAKIASLNSEFAEIEADRNDQQILVDAKIADAWLISETLTDLYADAETYSNLLISLRHDLSVLQGQLTELQEDPEGNKTLIENKQAEIAAKQEDIEETEALVSDTQKLIDESTAEYQIALREANILNAELNTFIANMTKIKLQITALEKRKEYLTDNMPEDATVQAWCADLTTDLTGTIGTIEIPGERGVLQVQPGYDGNATYSAIRDGQLFPAVSLGTAQALYNFAMFPGWQKWQPTFRHGVISNIDMEANTATVTLEDVKSSQQNLNINQSVVLNAVPVEYMDCNASAFQGNDNILVSFTGQEFENPKIIGFKDHPKPCSFIIPYLFASELTFDTGGLLLCMGGSMLPTEFALENFDENSMQFVGEFEIASPYGPTSANPYMSYPPFMWEDEIIAGMVVDRTDDNGVYWDEYPWMGDNWEWDPTYWETYQAYLDADDRLKPYGITIESTRTVEGDVAPDVYVGTSETSLVVDDISIYSAYMTQWHDSGKYYVDGETLFSPEYSIDQDDPTKYFCFYIKKYGTGLSSGSPWFGSWAPVEWSTVELYGVGLGHNIQIPNDGSAIDDLNIKRRLYKIDGIYIFYFTLVFTDGDGTHKYIGSVVEGGDYNLIDATDGFDVDGVTYQLFQGNSPISLGIIQRGRTA